MAEWTTLRARFPDDEFVEIERIKEKYNISYNEIIRSAVKLYLGLTLAKEVFANTSIAKDIKILNKSLAEVLEGPLYQTNIEQKISKLVKLGLAEVIETGLDFRERTRAIRKPRKVGRPKKPRKVGRPKSYEE